MRTVQQVREHYEIEKEIAERLRRSSAGERSSLYAQAYDELFQRVPHHPLLEAKVSGAAAAAQREIAILERFVDSDNVYLEVGPGDCSFAIEMAKRVRKVYAVDVSNEITKDLDAPPNFELLISDGTSIPVANNSIDVVYSNQLMEHLHPDDAEQQLRNIYRVLKPGGVYYCVTPNRLSGPHDISRDFDIEATGLHLKEYTVAELDEMFKAVGFFDRKVFLGYGKTGFLISTRPYRLFEKPFGLFPDRIRKLITFNRAVRLLLGIRMIGRK